MEIGRQTNHGGFCRKQVDFRRKRKRFEMPASEKSGENFERSQILQKFKESKSIAVTFAKDSDSAEKIVKVLGNERENKSAVTAYTTETSFTEKGIERKTVSAFGLLGTILEQLDE